MFRTRTLMAFLLVAMVAGLVLAGSGTAWAQNQTDVFWVAYFSGGATSATAPDTGVVQIINPGVSGSSLWKHPLDRVLSVEATTRNWKTVNTLHQMCLDCR